jgi:ferritin-like metal-binding protein YciE
MIEKSTNRELAKGLRDHLRETEGQLARLDKVFEKLGLEPEGTDCPGIDGLIKEADELAGEVEDKEVLDAAVIGSAQAIEHYEISRYGTLIAWAQELGHDNVTNLLKANLREEKAADKKLNVLVEGKVNRRPNEFRRRSVQAQRADIRPHPHGPKAASSAPPGRNSAFAKTKAGPRRTLHSTCLLTCH